MSLFICFGTDHDPSSLFCGLFLGQAVLCMQYQSVPPVRAIPDLLLASFGGEIIPYLVQRMGVTVEYVKSAADI